MVHAQVRRLSKWDSISKATYSLPLTFDLHDQHAWCLACPGRLAKIYPLMWTGAYKKHLLWFGGAVTHKLHPPLFVFILHLTQGWLPPWIYPPHGHKPSLLCSPHIHIFNWHTCLAPFYLAHEIKNHKKLPVCFDKALVSLSLRLVSEAGW